MKPVVFARVLICAVLALVASSAQARFLQVDPVGYADQINLYAYVGDDPIDRSDPTGLCVDNTCPVSGFFGSTGQNLQTRQTEERAGAIGVPVLAGALASPVIFAAVDSAAVSVGARGFEATRSSLGMAERLSADGLRRTMTGSIDKIRNILTNNATKSDFVGAAREARGISTGFDHATEMKNSIKGLTDAARSLAGSLRNPNLSSEARATLQGWKNAADTAIRSMKDTLKNW